MWVASCKVEAHSRTLDATESTNSRVMWYSVFTIVVLLGLGAAQVWILRRDFKAKKLIY